MRDGVPQVSRGYALRTRMITNDPVKIASVRYRRLLDRLIASRPGDPDRPLLKQATDLAARELTNAIASGRLEELRSHSRGGG
jgi:hypothetical protein